ncbi:cell division ABC transporter subunit FtsX [Rhodobacteraceae bacterium THAF1]|uniref:cell division protein FtsX n=1 Tax=Palleronia sp. THAF1 TaxID=2587842 RepID=UPI000F41A592|nr:FtsX-like permease family protein [Palleronia sp. THAF1]QFU09820.1 cell division ABC transporter subunit FtsX [Palleronia sp. THAF1]VDC17277.1 cell division ABC transporter subunit FtsX [Rhodobacteraceae bacterium THAF1]
MKGDTNADRIVPARGFSARLTVFTAAAMAFLAVFAMALSLATSRLAERWSTSLAQSSTIRISAPMDQREVQVAAVLRILSETPGVAFARAIPAEEQRALLAPWFGPDLPVEALPIPQLIEVIEDDAGFDAEGLRLRLGAEAPGAVLDDHTRWRRPLVRAADRLNTLGLGILALITLTMASMVTLAAGSALAANREVMRVLRLIGARDVFIARAFVRRFTLRALGGAALGTVAGMIAIWALPSVEAAGGFLTGLGFTGFGWLAPMVIPPVAGIVAFWATRITAMRALKDIP